MNIPLYTNDDWQRDAEENNPHEPWREETRRDYARVIHSPSFRRLQGKTQLFPGHESDFFRNRLTHSLEVAQIAESIACRLNYKFPYFKKNPIDVRLCATAGLIHDLGHPPFGHNGEHALDDQMRKYGGFEGNAQTLRIIARLEKKIRRNIDTAEGNSIKGQDSEDNRAGLNLTYRTLAATLKYDKVIPNVRDDKNTLVKGYYSEESEYVSRIKKAIIPKWREGKIPFKTIECSIMDIADDIAYSTYDLEDSFKAGFITPAEILSSDSELLSRVSNKITQAIGETVTAYDVINVFWDMFSEFVFTPKVEENSLGKLFPAIQAYKGSKDFSDTGYLRTDFTSQLVGEFINSIDIELNEKHPPLSKAFLEPNALQKVETLKNYTYEATIFSTRLKVAEFRGYEVVSRIFEALSGDKGYLLMPDDTRALHRKYEANATTRMRVICDFVAGMTDRYALEFYARLHSGNPQSIFKPV